MASRRRISPSDDIQLTFDANSITTPLTNVPLRGANETISGIVSIPAPYNLIVVASHDTRIRVYDMGTVSESTSVSGCGQYQIPYQYPNQGATYWEFAEHTDQVRALTHLMDDIVVSVGDDRSICTWRATTGKRIARTYLENWILSVARIDSRRFVVGTSSGEMVICSHSGWGRDIRILRYIYKKQTSDWVFSIGTLENSRIATSCTHTKTVGVWDTRKKKSWKKTATLTHDEWIKCVAVSDDYLVTASYNGRLYIYKDDELQCTFNLKHRIQSIRFVMNNVLVILAFSRVISVISVDAKKGLSQITCRNPATFWAFDILHDGRLIVGGKDGIASIMTPTEEIRAILTGSEGPYETSLGEARTRTPEEAKEEVEVEGVVAAEMETGQEAEILSETDPRYFPRFDEGSVTETNTPEFEAESISSTDPRYVPPVDFEDEPVPREISDGEEPNASTSMVEEEEDCMLPEEEYDGGGECEEEDDLGDSTEGEEVESKTVRFEDGDEILGVDGNECPEEAAADAEGVSAESAPLSTAISGCGEVQPGGARPAVTMPLDAFAALDTDLYECKHVELQRWEAYGVTRSGIASLGSDDLAECLAAFLMHHRASRSRAYVRVKAGLTELFRAKFVDGDVLVGMSSSSNNNTSLYVGELRAHIEDTLEAIDGVGKQCGLQYRIDLFFEKLAAKKHIARTRDEDWSSTNSSTRGCCGLGRLFRRRRNESDKYE